MTLSICNDTGNRNTELLNKVNKMGVEGGVSCQFWTYAKNTSA